MKNNDDKPWTYQNYADLPPRRMWEECLPELFRATDALIGSAKFKPYVAGSKEGVWIVQSAAIERVRAIVRKAKGYE